MSIIRFQSYGRKVVRENWKNYDTITNRVYYLHEGSAYYTMDGTEYPLVKGHLYLFPQTLNVRFFQHPGVAFDHTYFNFIIHPPFLLRQVTDIPVERYPVIAAAVALLGALFEQYGCDRFEKQFSETVERYLKNLLYFINEIVSLNSSCDKRIELAVEYISAHYMEQLTVKRLAAAAHMEENYFIRLFKSTMQKSPYQYIKEYRLNMAVNLLQKGTPVKEVALLTGYLSPAAFSNAFKKQLGVSPGSLADAPRGKDAI